MRVPVFFSEVREVPLFANFVLVLNAAMEAAKAGEAVQDFPQWLRKLRIWQDKLPN